MFYLPSSIQRKQPKPKRREQASRKSFYIEFLQFRKYTTQQKKKMAIFYVYVLIFTNPFQYMFSYKVDMDI